MTTTTATMATTTRMRTAKMITTNDGMETSAQTVLPTTGTGAVGIVNEGLQVHSTNVVPLLIVAIIEGVIIAILSCYSHCDYCGISLLKVSV